MNMQVCDSLASNIFPIWKSAMKNGSSPNRALPIGACWRNGLLERLIPLEPFRINQLQMLAPSSWFADRQIEGFPLKTLGNGEVREYCY